MNRLEFRYLSNKHGMDEPNKMIYSYDLGLDHFWINWTYYTKKTDIPIPQIEQWTGLKDNNGVKIFEGDIVKARYEHEEPDFCIVKWGGDYPAFDLYRIGCNSAWETIEDDCNVLSHPDYDFEVIGNKHQNPALLEQSE